MEIQLKEKPVAQIKLIGGRHCLDFVNTVGGRKDSGNIREDKLSEYSDLLAWGVRVGLLSDAEAQKLLHESLRKPADANAVFKRAIALREAIYRISRAILQDKQIKDADLEILNRELLVAHSRMMLVSEKKNFLWQWDRQDLALDRILWVIADSAAKMLTTADLTRLRQCPGDDCGWLFDDTTRNRSRQWCDMKDCGNIAKVRRFRARAD